MIARIQNITLKLKNRALLIENNVLRNELQFQTQQRAEAEAKLIGKQEMVNKLTAYLEQERSH